MPAVDVVHPDDITHLAAHRGPALSVFIPTARHGPETQQGPTRLRNIVRSVTSDAEATFGADTTSQLLQPVLALADDSSVWQHQADGLAIADAINTGATINIAQPSLIKGAIAAILRY